MRTHPVLLLTIAALTAMAACETRSTEPTVAGIGGRTVSNVSAMTISPSQVTVAVGSTVQLAANAGSGQLGQIQWASSNTSIATVSATGLVTAFAPGTATISARLLSDTTQQATASVLVTSQ
jgi:uncharacterized protein YjdB